MKGVKRKEPRRRKATNPDTAESSLSPQQETAVDLLAVGRKVTDVAGEIGVARQTVSQWLNRDDEFRAALNVRRRELWQATSDRLRSLLRKALDAIEGRLDAEDGLAAAVHVLKAVGLYGAPVKIGATEGEEYEAQRLERQADLRQRRIMASII